MVEVDYPHGDSTWPDTQTVIDTRLGGVAGGGPTQDDASERSRPLPLAPAPRDSSVSRGNSYLLLWSVPRQSESTFCDDLPLDFACPTVDGANHRRTEVMLDLTF